MAGEVMGAKVLTATGNVRAAGRRFRFAAPRLLKRASQKAAAGVEIICRNRRQSCRKPQIYSDLGTGDYFNTGRQLFAAAVRALKNPLKDRPNCSHFATLFAPWF